MDDSNPPKDLTGLHDLPPLGFDPIGMPIMPEQPEQEGAAETEDAAPQELSQEPPADPFAEPPLAEEIDASPAVTEPDLIEPEAPEPPRNNLAQLTRYAHKDQGPSRDPILVTLKIKGRVGLIERDRLLRLISEHELGISAQEIDIQIRSGRLLIPRINEYAATRIVQELRDSALDFVVQDASDTEASDTTMEGNDFTHTRTFEAEPVGAPLDEVRICTREDLLETEEVFEVIEIAHTVRAQTVIAQKSDQYGLLLGRVKLELKARARILGAHAIVDFQTTLDALKDPANYMLTVRGYLVRFRSQ
jgi:hypothetical protein